MDKNAILETAAKYLNMTAHFLKDWSRCDPPTQEQLERVLEDVKCQRQSYENDCLVGKSDAATSSYNTLCKRERDITDTIRKYYPGSIYLTGVSKN